MFQSNILNVFPNFRFESPWFLLLILPFLVRIYITWTRKQPAISVPWTKPFKLSSSSRKFNRTYIPLILYSVAMILLVVALARPQTGIEELKQKAEGIDIILCMDLSGSMKALDIPQNISREQLKSMIESGKIKERVEFSKQEIRKFIEKRPSDRIGLVVFAPTAYMACPPTLDHTLLLSYLKILYPGIVGDTTNIAAPLAMAVSRLKDSNSKRKIMVLFTDGSNNVNDRVTPQQAAKMAKTYNIAIYTVGLGSDSAFILQNTPFGSQFIPIGDQFDKDLLVNIAIETGGKFYMAADSDGLEKVMQEINKLEKTAVDQPIFIDYSELAPKIMIIALILLVLAFVSERTIFLRIP